MTCAISKTEESRRLREALRNKTPVLLVGTGVSVASSGSAVANWVGLLNNALETLPKLVPERVASIEHMKGLLGIAVDSGDITALLSVASFVSRVYRDIGETAYASWLSDSVGSLEPVSQDLVEAILDMNIPILTTNYDTLLEQVGKRGHSTWQKPDGLRDILRGSSNDIGHLHGVWENPSSVILAESDYQRLLDSDATQSLQRAIAMLGSIIYIGFGAGLEDPNFSMFLDWQRKLFPNDSGTHFRLCLERDKDDLARIHINDSIVPVSYGDDHGDLPGFIRSLIEDSNESVPSTRVLSQITTEHTQEMLLERAASASALSLFLEEDINNHRLLDPPILIPVPHTSSAQDAFSRHSPSLKRIDPHDLARQSDSIIIAGDEGSGVSTAITWLAVELSKNLETAPPVFLDFTDIRTGRQPFLHALQRACTSLGIPLSKDGEVPDLVVVIDNFKPTHTRRLHRVQEGLKKYPPIALVIGCHTGAARETSSALKAIDREPKVLHTGRLTNRDVRRLADRISPDSAESLAKKAIRILHNEEFQRTHFNISLVLVLLSRGLGEGITSETDIIEAYIDLLIQVTDPESSDVIMEPSDFHSILAYLAATLTKNKEWKVPEARMREMIKEAFDLYGWRTVPLGPLLEFFVRCQVLQLTQDGNAHFARNSYFLFYAAKFAASNKDFRHLLFSDIVFYQPVVSKYASLVPSDEDLLIEVAQLLSNTLPSSSSPPDTYKASRPFTEASQQDIETTLSNASKDAYELVTHNNDLEFLDDLDFPDPSTGITYYSSIDVLPKHVQTLRVATLASVCVRDLSQVTDLQTKRSIFIGSLALWGKWLAQASVADSLLGEEESAAFMKVWDIEPEELSDPKGFLRDAIPIASTMAGIEQYLGSPRLDRLSFEAQEHSELSTTLDVWIAALIFLIVSRPKGWGIRAQKLLKERTEKPRIVTLFLRALCEHYYEYEKNADDATLKLCKDLFRRGFSSKSNHELHAYLEKYDENLRKKRQLQTLTRQKHARGDLKQN